MVLYRTKQWFNDHRMPVRIVICKSRRAGLSTGVEALIYDDTTTYPNTKSLIVANERNPSENVLAMCTLFWRHTPEYLDAEKRIRLRPFLPKSFNNNPPKDRLEFDEPLSSRIILATARSLDAYLGFGFRNIHATEASRYADGHELFRALYPTLSTDVDSSLYIESTPNGQEGRGRWFYEQVMDAYARKNTQYGEMRLVFIPWQDMTYSFAIPFESPEKRSAFERSLMPTERDVMKRFPKVTLEQMKWRRMMLAGPTFNRDEDTFDQEYPTSLAESFLLSGHSVFGRSDIKRLMANARPPIWEGDVFWGDSDESNRKLPIHEAVRRPHFLTPGEAKAQGREPHTNEKTYKNLKVWRWPKPGERIFIAADVGGGNPQTRDGDFSVVQVGVLNELSRDEIIMKWKGHLNPIAFAELISALAWGVRLRVGENVVAPLLAPEWNGPGVATCTYIDKQNLYPNLYRYQQPGIHRMPPSKHVGWESNAKTKPIMVQHTLRMVQRDIIDIPDMETIIEMSSYRQHDSMGDEGSWGGAAGRHDDDVSALQIFCALVRIYSSILPGDAEVEQVDMMGDDEGDEAFDPFNSEVMPGVFGRDLDDDALEEAAFW
jgi:hypothetical protein